ncbi:MAG: CopD family protein [Burkholderiaceae bacterium]
MNDFWVLLHLTGVVVWLGGMFFALACLRPSLAGLPAVNRAPLMAEALGRFFRYVGLAVAGIWLSGILLIAPVGMKAAPLGWHLMIGAALLMTVVFLVIRLLVFPRVQRAIADGLLPVAGAGLNQIRWLVVINLVLGVIAVWGVTSLH